MGLLRHLLPENPNRLPPSYGTSYLDESTWEKVRNPLTNRQLMLLSSHSALNDLTVETVSSQGIGILPGQWLQFRG